jgi:hypothetical protein
MLRRCASLRRDRLTFPLNIFSGATIGEQKIAHNLEPVRRFPERKPACDPVAENPMR